MRLFILFVAFSSFVLATTLSLEDSPNWQVPEGDQRGLLTAKPGVITREISYSEKFGATVVLLEMEPPAQERAKGLAQMKVNVRGGFVHGISKSGHTVTEHGDMEFGPLPGSYITAVNRNNTPVSVLISVGGYAADKLYSISFYVKKEPDVPAPDALFVKDYLSRLRFSDVQQPISVQANPESRAFKVGQLLGYLSIPLLLLVGGSLILWRMKSQAKDVIP